MVKKVAMLMIILLTALTVMPLQAATADRIGAVYTNGDIWVKDGPTYATWQQVTHGVTVGDLDIAGNWITDLDASSNVNDVSVKAPNVDSGWKLTYGGLGSDAKETATAQLSNGTYRLLILATNGNVYMKDGAQDSGFWSGTLQPSSGTVSHVYASGDRIGVLETNGNFYVKQLTPGNFSHPNNVDWTLEAINASQGAITNNRIAYLSTANAVFVKEGDLNAGYNFIFRTASQLKMAANKICVIQSTDNNAMCKDGPLSATAVLTYNNVSQIEVSPTRFAVVTPSHDAYVMDGPLYSNPAGWKFVGIGNISRVELQQ